MEHVTFKTLAAIDNSIYWMFAANRDNLYDADAISTPAYRLRRWFILKGMEGSPSTHLQEIHLTGCLCILKSRASYLVVSSDIPGFHGYFSQGFVLVSKNKTPNDPVENTCLLMSLGDSRCV